MSCQSDWERTIAENVAEGIRTLFFFLDSHQQSCFVSFLHYFIFAVGFYIFFFTKYEFLKIVFFIFVVGAAASYDTLNRCIFTSIERCLCSEENPIQRMMCNYFGEEIEGNESSKYFLKGSSVVLGSLLIGKHIIKRKDR